MAAVVSQSRKHFGLRFAKRSGFFYSRTLVSSAKAPTGATPLEYSVKEGSATSTETRSSCLPNTVMDGLAWLKDQKPVIAGQDSEYPTWLWNLLEKNAAVGSASTGSSDARRGLRKANRKNIKNANFMKAQ